MMPRPGPCGEEVPWRAAPWSRGWPSARAACRCRPACSTGRWSQRRPILRIRNWEVPGGLCQRIQRGRRVPVAHNGAGALGQQLCVLCGQLPQAAMRDKQQCLFPQRRQKNRDFPAQRQRCGASPAAANFPKLCARVQNPAADQIV